MLQLGLWVEGWWRLGVCQVNKLNIIIFGVAALIILVNVICCHHHTLSPTLE